MMVWDQPRNELTGEVSEGRWLEIDCITPEEGVTRTARVAEIEAEVAKVHERIKNGSTKQDEEYLDALLAEYKSKHLSYVVDPLASVKLEKKIGLKRIARLGKKANKSQEENATLYDLIAKHMGGDE